MRPWDGVISEQEEALCRAAGFGKSLGMGTRPALLIIDVQYRTAGTRPMPHHEAIKEFPTSCGEVAWKAIKHLQPLLEEFRQRDFPVLYPYVAPKQGYDAGRLSEKVPSIMTIPDKGYDFVAEVSPRENDVLVPKRHPSAFFGTPLLSYLINFGVDTLFVAGCTTSGCVRATVVDAFSYNFRVIVPQECVYDRSPTSHAVNLFDMAAKYADVMPVANAIESLRSLDQP